MTAKASALSAQRILLAEDDDSMRGFLTRALAKAGYEVIAFANGAEAFKAGFDKALKNYDLVLAYGKDTAEAVVKSATAAGKGVETLNSEIYN